LKTPCRCWPISTWNRLANDKAAKDATDPARKSWTNIEKEYDRVGAFMYTFD
jgi:hypothetical protein